MHLALPIGRHVWGYNDVESSPGQRQAVSKPIRPFNDPQQERLGHHHQRVTVAETFLQLRFLAPRETRHDPVYQAAAEGVLLIQPAEESVA
ncbi:hypothetical protein D3C75_1032180 [compost metagenome]